MTRWHTRTPDEPDWMPKRRRLDAHGRPELWVNPALFGDGATRGHANPPLNAGTRRHPAILGRDS